MAQHNHTPWIALGMALGATAMCLLDPTSGRRRRARVTDKARRLGRQTKEMTGATARDVRNRMAGVAARAKRLAPRRETVPDVVLDERVRAALGRIVSHPGALDVETVNGCVCLSGPILTAEADRALSAAADISGVREVVDLLDRHDTADLPSLQGGENRVGPSAGWRRMRWTPTMRLLAGAGALATTVGVVRKARHRRDHPTTDGSA